MKLFYPFLLKLPHSHAMCMHMGSHMTRYEWDKNPIDL